MERRRWWIALVWIVLCSGVARGEDAYFHVTQNDLAKVVDGKLPQAPLVADDYWMSADLGGLRWPYAVVDGHGEAYAFAIDARIVQGRPSDESLSGLFIRAPSGADVSGRLYLPSSYKKMAILKFKIPASSSNDKFRKDFLQAKAAHYQRLVAEGLPGGAWFRREAHKAREALGEKEVDGNGIRNPNAAFINRDSIENTYELFSGGRALSENLQLDRALPAGNRDVPTIEASSLDGITIAAIDWSKYLKTDAHPALDSLAAAIPEDQHAVFFSSFAKLLEVLDQIDRQGTTILQLATPQSQDARVRARYEMQLCLSSSALSRLLGAALVRSVAVTGSDPYFPTGTDVAVLFDAADPAALQTLLLARVTASGDAADPTAKPVAGSLGVGAGAIPYSGMRSADRRVCSYVARFGDVVAVTNSQAQLERLAEVHQHKRPALAGLPEFKFFRTRYPLGAADESALVFLSDPTIRRWCGPKWRIASSRRTCDLSVMNDLQADFFDSLVAGHVEAGPIHTNLNSVDLGELRLTASGVRSTTLGTLEFQTPIVELPWDKVTQAEAANYGQWRDNYQRNWRWAFDPIALRIHCGEKRLAADLTVMPLIFASEYREGIEISRGTKLAPTTGDPHDAAVQWAMAINRDARPMRSAGNLLQGAIPGQTDPLSWIGTSVAAWVEDDPFWDELAQKNDQDREKFFETNMGRLPVAVLIDVSSRIKLTAFLVGLRGMVEQTAPGMISWESQTYHEQAYVRLTPTELAKKELPPGIKEPSLYYAILPEGLLLTLNQRLLEQAIDRQAARQKADANGKAQAGPRYPWLGASQSLQINQKAMAAIALLGGDAYTAQMQRLAWSNLPILNEWKRRYPDRDPVALHEQFWQTQLVCPGGGKYVWNDEWQTMESTVFGHPGLPKSGPPIPPALATILHANFGLTFEDEGLRARLELEQAVAKPNKPDEPNPSRSGK